MSTKFTINKLEPEIKLPLGQLLTNAHQWLNQSLVELMKQRGHTHITGAHLTFLSNLDCGITHASEVARRMSITRQGVYRFTRELQNLGVLELIPDPNDKRQKIINMTSLGNEVANDARACLSILEQTLVERIGREDLKTLSIILEQDWGPELTQDQ